MKCPDCATVVTEESLSCPSCGFPLGESEESFAPTRKLSGPPKVSGPQDAPTRKSTPSRASRTPSSIHDCSIEGARFIAGTMLAERYRIVGLLGRGGMGEVYRADDLKLEQPVALKLLPEQLTMDGAALARFHREVRIARQISHRNVCRVYDIGETEGLHFVSMEFIKGEELSSVIKRFGRLPQDKALEIARQICAGLAAAHDAGVLHRDLKPANIMIDERGDARIMDFGLAGLAEEFAGEQAIEGTPEYMSPEQLAGGELTVRSDIYSLGLVLYELFTGKKAFTAATLPDLIRLRKSETMPEHPSLFVRDIDPLVERVIERCLAADPKERPASALQVAAALPGGDPLAAALAAGETPSPEMVAASSTEGALRPGVAAAIFAGFLIALVAALFLSQRVSMHRLVPFEKSPQVLGERAGELLVRLGYAAATDSADGFFYDLEYIRHVVDHDRSPARWDKVGAGQPAVIYFWHRRSPRYLEPYSGETVTESDPPPVVSDMAGVTLDTRGRLLSFYGVPPQINQQTNAPPAEFDWAQLFREAGFDITKFEETGPEWIPPHPFDAQRAWKGIYPDRPDVGVRVEAASFRGRPVYFQVVNPWSAASRQSPPPERAEQRYLEAFVILVFGFILFGAVLLARRNLRLGRGDRRGAFRLAAVMFAMSTLAWLSVTNHVPRVMGEFALFMENLAWSLLIAALVWLVYVALEPFVRRRWPGLIVGWSRLLAGGWRDPLVGRDVLIGAAFGACVVLLSRLSALLPRLLGLPGAVPDTIPPQSLSGTKALVSTFSAQVINSFIFPAVLLFLLLLFSIILRRRWLAVGLLWLVFVVPAGLVSENPALGLAFAAVETTLLIFILLRFGLLAMVSMQFFAFALFFYPVTTDLSAWYAGSGIFSLAVAVAVAAHGFYTSLAGQKLFKGDLIGD